MIDYYKDIILENNLSLKRNIEGYNFPVTLSEKDSLEIIEKFREIYGDELILLDEIDENTLNKLINSGIISPDSKNKEAVIGLVFKDDYILVINDSDHISINISNFGEDLKLAYERSMEIEKELDEKFDFSFSPQYGYLTSFGRNSGSGIEIRLKLFLFGLLDNTQAFLTLKSSLAHEGIFLARFVPEYFKSYDEPTIICIFGDHQPQNYDVFMKLIKSSDNNTNKDVFYTPFTIWANYDIEEEKDVNMSLNYLTPYLLQKAGGIKLSAYEKVPS